MSLGTELLVILLLVLANAAFAAAEVAILTVRKSRLIELADEGRHYARKLLELRQQPERFLATVQVGMTLVSVSAAAFGGATIARALSDPLSRWFTREHAQELAFVIVVAVISFISVVIGELVPKSIALRHAEWVARVAVLPLRICAILLRPAIWGLTASSNVLLRIIGDKTQFTEARLSREELQQLVDEATIVGSIEPNAGDIASRALDFGHTRIGAVLVPRPEMVVVGRDATFDEVRELLIERFHERYPVRQASVDDIIGYATARDLIKILTGSGPTSVAEVVREALWFPEGVSATKVLREMQAKRVPLALVLDEQGSVEGLATIEDLVAELVGEVGMEDAPIAQRIRREADGKAIVVHGHVPIHEVNRELELDLPLSEDWSTIAGLVIARLGAIPKPGARLVLEDATVLEVLEASERRVTAIRIWPPPASHEEVNTMRARSTPVASS